MFFCQDRKACLCFYYFIMNRNNKKDILLAMIRKGAPMTFSQQARLVLSLATPAILAQLTTTMMQYIDASMVGSLGASASAAIGLVETTMWLMGSICSAAAAGPNSSYK